MKNAFGIDIPPRSFIARNSRCREYAGRCMDIYLDSIGVKNAKHQRLKQELFRLLESPVTERHYEKRLRDLIGPIQNKRILGKSRDARAGKIYRQIEPYILPGKVLDMGAGDGMIGRFVRDRKNSFVVAAELFRSPDFRRNGLPFVEIQPREKIPLPDGFFDTVLLCNVLHHSESPRRTLEEAARLARNGGAVVIVDAFIGVAGTRRPPGRGGMSRLTELFLDMSPKEQFAVTAWIDHLANTGGWSPDIEQAIGCPLNFNSPAGWSDILKGYNMKVKTVRPFGVDQPLGAGMFHGLIVATKRNRDRVNTSRH